MTRWLRFTLLSFSMTWFSLAAPAAEDAGQDPSTTRPAAQSFPSADRKRDVIGRATFSQAQHLDISPAKPPLPGQSGKARVTRPLD